VTDSDHLKIESPNYFRGNKISMNVTTRQEHATKPKHDIPIPSHDAEPHQVLNLDPEIEPMHEEDLILSCSLDSKYLNSKLI